MKDLDELEEIANKIAKEKEIQEDKIDKHLHRLAKICKEGLIDPPERIFLFFHRCPKCKNKLTNDKYWNFIGNTYHYKCTKCDYEWVVKNYSMI